MTYAALDVESDVNSTYLRSQTQSEAAQLANGNSVVVWLEADVGSTANQLLKAQIYGPDGSPLGGEITLVGVRRRLPRNDALPPLSTRPRRVAHARGHGVQLRRGRRERLARPAQGMDQAVSTSVRAGCRSARRRPSLHSLPGLCAQPATSEVSRSRTLAQRRAHYPGPRP